VLRECQGRWRVVLDSEVEEFFGRRGLLSRLKEWARELEENLGKSPPPRLFLDFPVIYSVGEHHHLISFPHITLFPEKIIRRECITSKDVQIRTGGNTPLM